MKTECYGNFFPDLDELQFNEPCAGEIFSVILTRHGFGSIQTREMQFHQEKWDACNRCDQYRMCYDLSMAKQLLWLSIHAGF